jgi:hypothetical protein
MKRNLLTLVVMAIALLAAKLDAQAAPASKTVTPDWHYRWQEGRWWYWMPEGNWMVWTGSTWVPYEESSTSSDRSNASNASPAKPATASFAAYETVNESAATQPADSNQGYCPPTSSGYSGFSGYSSGSGSNYAGYGWTWGPGTANRDSPGRRF